MNYFRTLLLSLLIVTIIPPLVSASRHPFVNIQNDQYHKEDEHLCILFDKLYDHHDPMTYNEIAHHVSQFSTIKSHHPKLVCIVVEKRGYELFKSIKKLSYNEMPPRFAKKKHEVIDKQGIVELWKLYRKISHKFEE